MTEKTPWQKLTQAQRSRRTQIVAQLFVRSLTGIRPGDYGANHVGAALDRVLITLAIRDFEAAGIPATAASLRRKLKLPEPTVRRALNVLVDEGLLRRVERHYVVAPTRGREARFHTQVDEIAHAIMVAARELATI